MVRKIEVVMTRNGSQLCFSTHKVITSQTRTRPRKREGRAREIGDLSSTQKKFYTNLRILQPLPTISGTFLQNFPFFFFLSQSSKVFLCNKSLQLSTGITKYSEQRCGTGKLRPQLVQKKLSQQRTRLTKFFFFFLTVKRQRLTKLES